MPLPVLVLLLGLFRLTLPFLSVVHTVVKYSTAGTLLMVRLENLHQSCHQSCRTSSCLESRPLSSHENLKSEAWEVERIKPCLQLILHESLCMERLVIVSIIAWI